MNEAVNCGGPARLRMIERWPKMNMIFGAALILIGVISACFKIETELNMQMLAATIAGSGLSLQAPTLLSLECPEYRSYSQALHW